MPLVLRAAVRYNDMEKKNHVSIELSFIWNIIYQYNLYNL